MDTKGGAGIPVRQWTIWFHEYSIMEGVEGPYVEVRAATRGYSSVIRFEWAEWKRRIWPLAFVFAFITSAVLWGIMTILSKGGAESFFGLSIMGLLCLLILPVAIWALPSVYHTYKYARERAVSQ